jgi:hypothetical protein
VPADIAARARVLLTDDLRDVLARVEAERARQAN